MGPIGSPEGWAPSEKLFAEVSSSDGCRVCIQFYFSVFQPDDSVAGMHNKFAGVAGDHQNIGCFD